MKSNKSLIVLILASAMGALVFSGSVRQQSAKELFERAAYLEETKGELEKAIEAYKRILEQFADNHGLAAKALYRIGLCHEKLGSQEAEKAYRRLIEQYPGQKEEVALARARLADLTATVQRESRKPTFRKIRIPANPGNGVLSPDGKKFAFVSQGSVWVVPIPGKVQSDLAGEPIRLTEPMGAWNLGNTMAWSGDGKWIAFNVLNEKPPHDIYVVSSQGGRPRKVPVRRFVPGGSLFGYRVSLSEGGRILVFSSKDNEVLELRPGENHPSFLYAVPASGGNVRRLTDTWAYDQAFSPDGKRIAYTQQTQQLVLETSVPKSDLWIANADGSAPMRLTDLPGRIKGPVFSPDGRMIAFIHVRGPGGGSREIWIQPVPQNGKNPGTATKIELPLASSSILAGWTADHKIGLLMWNPVHQAVYTVPASGGRATQVTPEADDAYPCYPKWSPDGKTLYLRERQGDIVSVPAQGGSLTVVHDAKKTRIVSGIPGMGNGISPDGKTILFMAYKSGILPLEVNIWTKPIGGGEARQITKSPTQDRYPCWSPDGKSVAFIRTLLESENEAIRQIFVTSSEGGAVHQITSESDRVGPASIDWSPDGKMIAYFSRDNTINLIPAQGGEPKVLSKVEDFHGHCDLAWSPDGTELAYTSAGRLMVVSLKSGATREVQTGILEKGAQNFHIDWSPDGTKFAFSAGFG